MTSSRGSNGSTGRPLSVPARILHRLLLAGPGDLFKTELKNSLREYVVANGEGHLLSSRLVSYDPQSGEHRLGPGLGLVLAFSVGGEHVFCGLVDANGTVHHVEGEKPLRSQLRAGPDAVLKRLRTVAARTLAAGLKDEALTVAGLRGKRVLPVLGITAAWPMQLGRDTRPMNRLIGDRWTRKTLREHLGDALDVPLNRCHAMNDANAGAFAAAFRQPADVGVGAVLCVHASAGIGLGTVHMPIPQPGRKQFIDAILVAGQNGLAGEIGHCRIDDGVVAVLNKQVDAARAQGHVVDIAPIDPKRECVCGREGHLEAVFGADALLERLGRRRPRGPHLPVLDDLRDLAQEGDLDARRAFEDAGTGIGSLLAGVVFATDPAAICVTGAIANPDLVRALRNRLTFRNVRKVPIALYGGPPEEGPAALLGSALGVLRAGVYRGFFKHGRYVSGSRGRAPSDWSGWDGAAQPGTQSGELEHMSDASWEYTPFPVDQAWLVERGLHR